MLKKHEKGGWPKISVWSGRCAFWSAKCVVSFSKWYRHRRPSTAIVWISFAKHLQGFFPRASERRVLPIVGVCKTSSHLHIFSSSHLLIFTSFHLHIFSSSHLLIFTSSHLHIFSSSHLLIFTSSHLHIFSSSHSSHLHIFSSCPLALLPSCPLALLPSCPLALLPSCPLALLPSPSFLFISWRRGQGQWQRDGTKRNPFARNEVRSPKTEVKLRFQGVPRNPFARNEVR